MRIKIFITILIAFFSIPSFCKTKTLLHSFQRHFEVKEKYMAQCFGPKYIKGWFEDFEINMFSDSTFIMEYSCSGKSDGYHGYIKNEVVKGKYYKENDSIFLVKNKSEQLSNKSSALSTLNGLFNNELPIWISFTNDSLLIYKVETAPLVFTKASILSWYKKSRQVNAVTSSFSPQLSNITPSF